MSPSPEFIRFGILQVPIHLITYVRALALGKILPEPQERFLRSDLDSLATWKPPLALKATYIDGTVWYSATSFLLRQTDIHDRGIFTFQELAEKMGCDIGPTAVRKMRRKLTPSRVSCHKYPKAADVNFLWRSLGSAATENVIEQEGDSYQVSSPNLTAWYVKTFIELNQLKQE